MIDHGLVGRRLGHSHSPEIHGALADYKYELIEIPEDEIDLFFDRREFQGVNVTIPYKERVIPHLDEIEDAAREIGAVNTVVNRCGRLCGYNTDFIGMRDAILRAGIEISGRKVLILGTGGTSKTAAYVAKHLGAREIIFVSRRDTDGAVTYDEAYSKHSDASVIINTTPAGMFPDNYSSAIDPSRFPSLEGVFDAVFNPLSSKLVVDAKRLGVKASGGIYMLISQAVAAASIFTGKTYPEGTADAILRDILYKKQNIVLTGMPSSGKTTVGKMIASMTGREFVDTDEEIVRAEGRAIPEIFATDGEECFRRAEAAAIAEVSKIPGRVIATGGGAVLRRENVDALRQNGKIYFLDRSLENLVATGDRPLSSDRAALEARYRERIGIYNENCDVKIDSNEKFDSAAKQIIEDMKK